MSAKVSDAVALPAAVGRKSTWIVQLRPAATLVPQLFDAENEAALAPANPTLLTARGKPPVFVNVTVCAGLLTPIVSLPKLRLAGVTEAAAGAAAPVPLSATVAVPFVKELPITVICPAAAPAATGLNLTVNTAACPGFNVIGKVAPTREKPVPVSAAEWTVSAAVPVDVRVTDCVAAVPA